MKRKMVAGLVSVAMVLGAASAVFAGEYQPAMEAALKNLKEARMALENATADKGGHRVKAIKKINEAIREVEKGIAYDNRR